MWPAHTAVSYSGANVTRAGLRALKKHYPVSWELMSTSCSSFIVRSDVLGWPPSGTSEQVGTAGVRMTHGCSFRPATLMGSAECPFTIKPPFVLLAVTASVPVTLHFKLVLYI